MRHAWVLSLAIAGCSSDPQPASARSGTPEDTISRTVAPPPDTSSSEWRIGPAVPGALSAHSSEADLRKRHGAEIVGQTRIELGEGETAPGTVLYPDDSLRRLEIIWQDSIERRQPARVILRGKQSRWHVGRGISLGTSLQDLERLNGRPFMLAGFGWDYAGVVTGWEGGALDSTLAGVKLYLDPGPAQYESAPYSQVLGDRDYSSALPAMQQLNPRVGQVFVDFE